MAKEYTISLCCVFKNFYYRHASPTVTLPSLSSSSRYQADGNARVTTIDVTIGNKELLQLKLKYNQNIGTLESISDLRIYKNTFNKTVIHDTAKQFFSVSEYDNHGRLKSVMTNIKSMDVYRCVKSLVLFSSIAIR